MSSWAEMGGQVAAAEAFVLTALCVILVIDVFLTDRTRWLTYVLSLLTLAGAAYMTVRYGVQARVTAFDGMYIADPMGDVLKLFSYGTVAVSFLYSREYLQRRGLFKGEYFILGLVALLGVMVMVSAGSLLTVYLGVELLSLSLYAMVAFDRESGVAAESAMKYFVLGAISSGTLLYGFSIVYGVTGTLQLDELAVGVREVGAANLGLVFGLAFIIVGIAFKFGAVPFHMWVPERMPSRMKPTCEIVEYASMRLRFVCAIATTLPMSSDSTASAISMSCQLATIASRPSASTRIASTNEAIFGAEPMNSVTGVGAP